MDVPMQHRRPLDRNCCECAGAEVRGKKKKKKKRRRRGRGRGRGRGKERPRERETEKPRETRERDERERRKRVRTKERENEKQKQKQRENHRERNTERETQRDAPPTRASRGSLRQRALVYNRGTGPAGRGGNIVTELQADRKLPRVLREVKNVSKGNVEVSRAGGVNMETNDRGRDIN